MSFELSTEVPIEASQAAFEIDPDNGADEPDEHEANVAFAQRLVAAAFELGLQHYLIVDRDDRA